MRNARSSGVERRLWRNAQRGHSDPCFLAAITAQAHMGVNERERGTNGAVRSPMTDTIQEAALPPLATAASTVFVFPWRDGTVKVAEKPEFTLSGCNNPLFSRFSQYCLFLRLPIQMEGNE